MRINQFSIGIYFLLSVLLWSCQPTAVGPQQLLEMVTDANSNLLQSISIKGFRYSAHYLPVDYQIAREVYQSADYKTEIETVKSQYEGHHYCNFTIGSLDGKAMDEKLEALKGAKEAEALLLKYNFHSKDQFKLAIGRDTQTCVLYHMDRPNGLQMGLYFSLVFPAIDAPITDDVYVLFEDEHLSAQQIKIKIEKEAIHSIPFLQ